MSSPKQYTFSRLVIIVPFTLEKILPLSVSGSNSTSHSCICCALLAVLTSESPRERHADWSVGGWPSAVPVLGPLGTSALLGTLVVAEDGG